MNVKSKIWEHVTFKESFLDVVVVVVVVVVVDGKDC
jgi:hypothetical protein